MGFTTTTTTTTSSSTTTTTTTTPVDSRPGSKSTKRQEGPWPGF